jgi:hypothetical protein
VIDPPQKAELLDDRTSSLAPTGARGGRLWPTQRIPRIAPWLAVAVVAALVGGLVVLDSTPRGPSIAASPSPSRPAVADVTKAPAPTLTSRALDPCGAGRIQFAASENPSVPGSTTPDGTPPGLMAAAIESSASSGFIVVTETGIDGASNNRIVATFSGSDIQDPYGVSVVDWTAAGDAFLVHAGHGSMGEGDSSCADLYMVNADGSGVRYLTGSAPGEWIGNSALAPRTAQVAYLKNDEVWVTDSKNRTGGTKVGDCAVNWALEWSPDEDRLLALCNRDHLLVTGTTETPKLMPIESGAFPVAAAWSPDSSSITLVQAPTSLRLGPLTVLDVDPTTMLATKRLDTDVSTEWATPSQIVSPDGRWLLARGLELGKEPGQDAFGFFAVDLMTGVTRQLPWRLFNDQPGVESFGWLPDGETVLYGDGGTLFTLNVRDETRTALGPLPAPDFGWLARAP